ARGDRLPDRERVRREVRRAADPPRDPALPGGPALGEDPAGGVRAGRRDRGHHRRGQGVARLPGALEIIHDHDHLDEQCCITSTEDGPPRRPSSPSPSAPWPPAPPSPRTPAPPPRPRPRRRPGSWWTP